MIIVLMRLQENKHSSVQDYVWTQEINGVLTNEKWIKNDDDDIVLICFERLHVLQEKFK